MMKKLMVMFAAVAMVGAAQAATVYWTAMNIKQAPSGSTTYYAYLVDVTGLTATYASAESVALALHDGTFTGTTMYSKDCYLDSIINKVSVYVNSQSLPSGYAANQTVSYYSILFDAANAADAKYWTSTSNDNDFSVKTATINSSGMLDVQHNSSSSSWTAVPEPTSGLLLLVGGALLALRRRRA